MPKQPQKQGLYRPENEHDACGVGFVARLNNQPSHDIVAMGLRMLVNMTHRGAVGANPTTGDGAGMLIQLPDALFRRSLDLPPDEGEEHAYAVGAFFLPQDGARRAAAKAAIGEVLQREKLPLIGWRDVPVDLSAINDEVAACAPRAQQALIGRGETPAGDPFERRLYVARKVMEKTITDADFYCVSLSSRSVVYKGMFLAEQLGAYYPDLRDEDCQTAFAVVHQRFSTNTFPAWKLAHPYRFIAHNGEINTLRGNVNNMAARWHSLSSPLFGADLEKLWPMAEHGQSDTATLDNAVELLCLAGYSPARALAALIPEAWQNNPAMPPDLADFYRYHAPMMEPWDGPAEVVFTDGKQIGAVLDRNGLRPGRYWLTDDGLIVMASEAGVLDVPESRIRRKWRIQPGKILLVDLRQKRLIGDDEIKADLARAHPYGDWAALSQRPPPPAAPNNAAADAELPASEPLLRAQQRFGYTDEDIKFILRPMTEDAAEPIGSMGDDAPPAALSHRMKPLSAHFRQEFAQVTNPAIDPIREELVMSLNSYLGARPNLLAPNTPPASCCVALPHPILLPAELAALRAESSLNSATLDVTFDENADLESAIIRLQQEALRAVNNGAQALILSDRAAAPKRIAAPILLATAAVHHALVAAGDRAKTGLAAETAAARTVHDVATLAGYGAEAICPYLACRTVLAIPLHANPQMDATTRLENYRKALGKGLLKVMSKMGISTFQSYCGAQIFEAVGLSAKLVDRYFCGTTSQIDGVGLPELEKEVRHWHDIANNPDCRPLYANALDAGGDFAFRIRGESHLWSPESVAALRQAVRDSRPEKYEEYAALINSQNERLITLRGMLEIATLPQPLPLEEVEEAREIIRRFSTGAMSFGSLSREAHGNLAVAMNRIGGKSNTGEGGEEPARFAPLPNGDSARSAIKQVASGRFGVSAEYLANSDMMQIKIAQGAKPGEGGQLPGHKVDEAIAQVRCSVPGVGLISPPPHHDIYSIEDIAQLIYDLKCANPEGEVSVKLVSRDGVGTVAAGVVKAKSDHVTIAGHDGGTGASPLSSIKHAGAPWELGLSETHQTLVLNDLRGRVALQVDGQIKTGRDVVIGALLGADEFGFATAPLVAQGCIMMRKCHLNTCPVGIATQDPRLRAKFAGKPEHVIEYFFFVAEEVRRLLAAMGFRKLDDIIGRADLLSPRPQTHWKAKTLDLRPLLRLPDAPPAHARRHCQRQDHDLRRRAIDYRWLEQARAAIDDDRPTVIADDITNADRTAGAVLSNAVVKKRGGKGMRRDLLTLRLRGVAGQSFGAFISPGMTMSLTGEANDYLGKGLSGGVLAVRPPESDRPDAENIIAGNTALYGAIGGECYCRGVVGERFAVRNSGARAVVEGCGDHGCEYMTGGIVVVLGPVGRNFAAGMSGGIAYVLDESGGFAAQCNRAMADLRGLESDPAISPDGKTDADAVRELLESHVRHTDSRKATALLENWEKSAAQFVKVMPHEYERALRAMGRKTA